MKKEIVVIGAGASGLMAAISAARGDICRVTVLEAGKKPGTKLLRTGNGRCNYTNLGNASGRYRGLHPEFAEQVLSKFGANETIGFFKQIGIYPYAHDGWVYPRSEQASAVLDCLLDESRRRGVRIKLNEKVTEVRCKEKGFEVLTEGWHYEADVVIVSAGTAASLQEKDLPPVIKLPVPLKSMPYHPALSFLLGGTPEEKKAWAGVRAHAAVSAIGAGAKAEKKRTGQIQFTPKGVSGIEVMNLSSLIWPALQSNKKKAGRDVYLAVDFLPELSENEIVHFLEKAPLEKDRPVLEGLIPKKIVPLIFKKADQCEGHEKLQSIAGILKDYRIRIRDVGPEYASQVLGGGIATEEIDTDTMMVKKCPGLFLTGEMLDIDGECGGWNLQFAWATGALAGKAAFQFGGVQHL